MIIRSFSERLLLPQNTAESYILNYSNNPLYSQKQGCKTLHSYPSNHPSQAGKESIASI